MEMALASLAMMLHLCVHVFHVSLNWHKNCCHWHWHACAGHWHQALEHKQTVTESVAQPSLQESWKVDSMVVVLCCCSYCSDHVVAAMVLSMVNATMARFVSSVVLGQYGRAAKVAS